MIIRSLALLILLSSCANFKGQRSLQSALATRSLASTFESQDETLAFPLKRFRISRGFSPGSLSHFGVDFVAPRGTPVYAAHNAKVVFAGRGFRGYGKLVVLEHPDGIVSFYAHLNSIHVKQGQLVPIRYKVGTVGATGNARGVHLHFELRLDGKAVNPMEHLQH